MRKKLVAGNWKMHGSRAMADKLVRNIVEDLPDGTDVLVFPPDVYLAELSERYGDRGLGFVAEDLADHERAVRHGQGALSHRARALAQVVTWLEIKKS